MPARWSDADYTENDGEDNLFIGLMKPKVIGLHTDGRKIAEYRIEFNTYHRTLDRIEVIHEGWERDIKGRRGDGGGHDPIFKERYEVTSWSGAGHWVQHRVVDKWDSKVCELYHRVRYQVTSYGVTGGWYPSDSVYMNSPIAHVYVDR
jgi:hypothetical protein